MEKTKEERLVEVGANAMSSIREMVAALNCDYDRLEELREEKKDLVDALAEIDEIEETEDYNKASEKLEEWIIEYDDELVELTEVAGDCESQDDARQRIDEDPLSLEVRSGWCSPGSEMEAEEYCLLLGTGGPAVRIVGDLDRGQPTRARLEVQDWFTPWTEHIATGSDHDVLMSYVQCFYFGD